MEFPTPEFALFFLVVLTVAWAIRPYRRLRNGFLLLVSYYFASRWNPIFLATIIGSSVFNYAVGQALHNWVDPERRKRVFWLGIAGNVGLLGFFKYVGFFVENLGALTEALGLEVHLPVLQILAPLGLSFYTFQAIAYLVDAYRGKAVKPNTLADFLLFQSFFPQLSAGPICRSHELLPQIMADAPKSIPQPSRAVVLIMTGLFKKMVLGTYLATHMTDDAFMDPASWSALELWVVVFAYTAQVYLDFSGYTDIARGVGLMLGFELPRNFRYPYSATNIGDYWRRWHISFSTWLRDYIYFPLGGSRVPRLRCYANLMVTFLVCGIWHGATWGYIIWGALHGLGLSLYKASLDIRRDMGIEVGNAGFGRMLGGWALTLSFCALARIYFKTPDLETAHAFFGGLFSFTLHGNGLDLMVVGLTMLTFALNFVGKPIFEWAVNAHARLPVPARPVAWAAVALIILTIRPYDISPTLYFQF